jgi:small subunit ribosomal protein S9
MTPERPESEGQQDEAGREEGAELEAPQTAEAGAGEGQAPGEAPQPGPEAQTEAEPEAAPAEGAPTEGEERPGAQDVAEGDAPPAPIDLAAEARYSATGKRKSSIARVTVRPGSGAFEINGRQLVEYFPRRTLQAVARQPLEVAGYVDRLDVRVKIHGGGVSSQADAVRHGVARALIEVDPNLRGELKRRQLLTRDSRVKERRKAGLKKARKRPQFSKR